MLGSYVMSPYQPIETDVAKKRTGGYPCPPFFGGAHDGAIVTIQTLSGVFFENPEGCGGAVFE